MNVPKQYDIFDLSVNPINLDKTNKILDDIWGDLVDIAADSLKVNHDEVRLSMISDMTNFMTPATRILTWLASGNPVNSTLWSILDEMEYEVMEADRVRCYQNDQLEYFKQIKNIIDSYPNCFALSVVNMIHELVICVLSSLAEGETPNAIIQGIRKGATK